MTDDGDIIVEGLYIVNEQKRSHVRVRCQWGSGSAAGKMQIAKNR